MPKRNIIVIGGSTGSFDAFKRIATDLPPDFEASVFIVWHMAPQADGILARVLDNCGPLRAVTPIDGEMIRPGTIYVARSDHHLLIDGPRMRVTRGPKENRFRPAVDPLFRSAAYSHGSSVIGIVLSGALDDGTSGLWTVKQRGGLAVVQDPNDADMPSMPENAMRQTHVDYAVPMVDMARLLIKASREEVSKAEVTMDEETDKRTAFEIKAAAEENTFAQGVVNWGQLSPFTCPECSGVLSKIEDGGRPRFRCHTGHAYSADSLLSSLTENIEESLWSAIRGVEESVMLLNHIGDHFADANQSHVAAKFFQKAGEASERNKALRDTVFSHERLNTEAVAGTPGYEGNGDATVLPTGNDPQQHEQTEG